MGVFSSKTKYYVASQIYNMAGDFAERPSYMKSLIVQSALIGDQVALRIRDGIFQGPGFNLRAFQKWANVNYRRGIPDADITVDEVSTLAPIRNAIPAPSGQTVTVINAVLTNADAEIWVEKFLAENHPQLMNLNWTFEQDDVSDVITISFANGRPDISFTPQNWYPNSRYLAARYVLMTPGSTAAVVNKGSFGPYRSAAGVGLARYTEQSRTNLAAVSYSLVRRETRRIEYKDARPATQSVLTSSVAVEDTPQRVVYRWDQNRGYRPLTKTPMVIRHTKAVTGRKIKRTVFTRNSVEYPDFIEIVSVENEILVDEYRYSYTTQERYGQTMSDQKVYIYRMGGNNASLNNLKASVATMGEFFPIIPLRLDNVFIDEPRYDDIYPLVSKAYKKAFGTDIEDVLDELKDNEQIDDLDFTFMVFGVHLNERSNAGKEYIYEFLKGLMTYQNSSKTEWVAYQTMLQNRNRTTIEYRRWENAMLSRLESADPENMPELPSYPPPKRSEFVLRANALGIDNYRISISWSYIAETFHAGRGKQGAKKGDLWFSVGPTQRGMPQLPDSDLFRVLRSLIQESSNQKIYLYHQTSDLQYRRLEIMGLYHGNEVYKNKSVVTSAVDGVRENSEESPFFFPLHYPTLKRLTPAVQNELGYCSRLLVLNSYQKVKIRWYQRGAFKWIFAIAMIAISIITLTPAAMAYVPGLLGTNIVVGTALGLAGTAAIVAGAVANMIASMILVSIIQKGAISLLGEKWGTIIGTIASFFALQVGTQFASTGSMAMNWGKMFNPNNILKLTNAVSKGYQGYVSAEMKEVMEGYETAASEYKDEMKMIEDRVNELFGQNAWIDPTLLTEMSGVDDASLRESSDSFLSRTLLTGSDIAEISMAMITEFPTASLALDKPIM